MLHNIASLDLSVLKALYEYRHLSVTYALIDVTELGSYIAILGIGACIALILGLRYRIAEMTGLIIALGGTAIASTVIKYLVHRARPSEYYNAYTETGYSFPSEHTSLATALAVFLVYLVFRLTKKTSARTIATCLGLILAASVGFSRLYLGVHYLSDVVAGLLLGTLIAGLGIITERSFEHVRTFARIRSLKSN